MYIRILNSIDIYPRMRHRKLCYVRSIKDAIPTKLNENLIRQESRGIEYTNEKFMNV